MSGDLRQAAADAIGAPGTPEGLWASWAALRRLPAVGVPDGPVVVVAAHPDDEVLGFGGTMARLAALGTDVHLVSITDGELSHPRSTLITAERLAEVRHAELRTALADLGLPHVHTERLSVPDTRVDQHESAVAGRIAALLREVGAALCVAPWGRDLHSDHEAAGRAAGRACQDSGVPLWMYPVWMWHWSRPGDPRVPWHDAVRLTLPAEALARKTSAIGQFVSQIHALGEGEENAAILPPEEVEHHTRPFEVVFR
ncbi:PIG-L family deacetylase [Streptomyces caniferus]|uniref:PIG-L deacetylase family protein n=1 Tax=Streptomyces caniferus TaxID=285557 RepID=UPI002E2BB404|nr:PIG-L family deacetylase [Streptomyces caniferus]